MPSERHIQGGESELEGIIDGLNQIPLTARFLANYQACQAIPSQSTAQRLPRANGD
jgi:hypothetical protein